MSSPNDAFSSAAATETAARAWIEGDPDALTRSELAELVASGDHDELTLRMTPLEFGTAGLRGLVGAGPGRVNSALLRRVTWAIVQVLSPTSASCAGPVVIGADARPSSARFLAQAVGVLAAHGVPTRFFPRPIATPLVAFAARQLNARCAMVITASHNPAAYNGLKVYGADAAQLVAPWDTRIQEQLRGAPRASEVPFHADAMQRDDPGVEPIDAGLMDEYFRQLALIFPKTQSLATLGIVYTPLHGVGWAATGRALSEAGFTHVTAVPEQVVPDGEFPTARSPNPEQPETLALALKLGSQLNATLVLANDPDADRMAACVRDAQGQWKILSGNQIGLLLADFVLERYAQRDPGDGSPLLVQSIVSSPVTEALAEAYGVRSERTLTGFKWIWSALLQLEQQAGTRFGFAYEQALGYCVTSLVRDKDGIAAALAFAQLASVEQRRHSSVLERLAALYGRLGLWVSAEYSHVLAGAQAQVEVEEALERLVREPPQRLGDWQIDAIIDYRSGEEQRPSWFPNAPLIQLAGSRGRLLVRPSGTEPKLKIYADLCLRPVPVGEDLWQLETQLEAQAKSVAVCLAQWLFPA